MPRTAIRKPHIIAVAGVRQDGSLGVANPLRSQSAGTPCVPDAHWRNRHRMTRRHLVLLENPRIRSGPACSMMAGADACDRIHREQVSDMSIF